MVKKKRKSKKKTEEKEFYEIEIEDWNCSFNFSLNSSFTRFDDDYWEHLSINMTGRIITPNLKSVNQALVEIVSDPELDDHWKPNTSEFSPKSIGFIQIQRDDNICLFYCRVPTRYFQSVCSVIDSGKLKYASIFGTKLKWRKGKIDSLGLSDEREEF